MPVHGLPLMRSDGALPRLDFGVWAVPFPDRGHHVFLSNDDLHATVAADPPAPGPGVWLMRTEAGAGVIIPSAVDVIRDGVPVVGAAALHHGERVEISSHLARFVEIQQVTLGEGSRLVGRQCPYCMAIHEIGKQVIRCPFCGEGYCLDCWELLIGARCCSRSCQLSPGALEEQDQP